MSYWEKVDPEQEHHRNKELIPWMKRMEEKLDKLINKLEVRKNEDHKLTSINKGLDIPNHLH